jgi:hypothetical protein
MELLSLEHRFSLPIVLIVVTAQMEESMQSEERDLAIDGMAGVTGLVGGCLDRDDDVAKVWHGALIRIASGERDDVGRGWICEKLLVQIGDCGVVAES